MKEEFTTIYMSLIKIIWKETELRTIGTIRMKN